MIFPTEQLRLYADIFTKALTALTLIYAIGFCLQGWKQPSDQYSAVH
jgi:hypothetical protein